MVGDTHPNLWHVEAATKAEKLFGSIRPAPRVEVAASNPF